MLLVPTLTLVIFTTFECKSIVFLTQRWILKSILFEIHGSLSSLQLRINFRSNRIHPIKSNTYIIATTYAQKLCLILNLIEHKNLPREIE